MASSSSNDNAPKIVETKEEKKKEKMSIVSTEKTAQMPSAGISHLLEHLNNINF
jgi:hypothetical protein